MSNIKSKDTKIERIVFKELRKNKICFQKNYKKVIGCPDIAFPRKKKAVFIDGDFWHGFYYLQGKKPSSSYWKVKLSSNIERDKKVNKTLKEMGWKTLRIWEHELKNKCAKETFQRLLDFIKA